MSQQPNSFGFQTNASGGSGGNTNVANADLTLDGNHTTDLVTNTLTFDSGTTNLIQFNGSTDKVIFGDGSSTFTMPSTRPNDAQVLTASGGSGVLVWADTSGANTNLANTNLVADAQRTYNINGNDLNFLDGTSSLLQIEQDQIVFGEGGAIDNVSFKFGTDAADIRIYEPSGSGGNFGKLTLGALGADRTYTFPDATGTIALTSDIPTDTNTNLANTNLTQTSATRNFDVGSTQILNFHTDGDTSKIGLQIDSDAQDVFIGNSDMSVSISAGTPFTTNSFVSFRNGTNAPSVRFFEASGGGTSSINLTCGALAANRTITMPDATGTIALTSDIDTYTAGAGLTLNTLEFDIDASQTTITSITNTSLVIGRDADNDIDFATDNQIKFRVQGSDEFRMALNVFSPNANNGASLGSGTIQWSDLFLASGAVINFNNGDVTLTHSANALTMAGGAMTFSGGIADSGTISAGTWSGTAIAVNKGGTGQTSYTNGQILIGNTTGNTLAKSTLTAGTNVTITNGAGAITIASTDTNTEYTAGDGLTLTGTEFDLDDVQTKITSITNGALVIGRDADNQIKFASDNLVDTRVGGTDRLRVSTTALQPIADGGLALGLATRSWQSLYLDSGAEINFDNSNVVITHSNVTLNIGSNGAGTDLVIFGGTASRKITWSAANDSFIGTGASIDLSNGGQFIGNLTGNATGSSGTTTSIGNLTGEVTSVNRATTIANDIVDEANLKVSNAPQNGYVLTAQSGASGGLTWAAESADTNTNIANTNLTQDAARSLTGGGNEFTFTGQSKVIMTSELELGVSAAPAVLSFNESGGTQKGKIIIGALTADRQYTLPNASGTFAFLGDINFTSLTTNNTSGAATLSSGVLNIPNYAATTYTAGDGITLNTLEFDLDADLTTVTSIKNTSLEVGRDADNFISFATDNIINFRFSGSTRMNMSNSGLKPNQSNLFPLGSGSASWADLFLGSGSVINFNNGDVVLTHSSNVLTLTGGDLFAPKVGGSSNCLIDFSSNTALVFRVNNADTMSLSDAALVPSANAVTDLGSTSLAWENLYLGQAKKLDFGNGTATITNNATNQLTIDATSGLTIDNRRFDVTSSTDGNSSGDICYLGSTSVAVGKVYQWSGTAWAESDADAPQTSTRLLGVALATGTSSSVGLLLRGMVTLDHDSGTAGAPLFVSTTAGELTSTSPSGSGDVVRLVGYCLDSTNGQVWFNPDNTFIRLA